MENDTQYLFRDENSDGHKVTVYLRALKTGSRYYARYKVDKRALANNQRYITESLRTNNLELALDRARERYSQISFRQGSGIALKEITVERALDDFLRQYERNLKSGISGYTTHMYRGFKKSIDIYWREYIGGKSISVIQVADFEGYELWRRDWAKNTKRKERKHGNYKTDISSRTVQWEINGFKQFLRWAAANGLYSGRAYEWRFKVGIRNRRAALTREQYRSLHQYMRTGEFLNKGKHRNDTRIRRHRILLRAYILFMVNTGLRVGEARFLKWSDITEMENKLGRKVLCVRVSKTHSKVSKDRTAVGRYTAHRALERWKEHLNDTGEGWNEDSYIFCNESGVVINDFREGFNNVLREADVEFDAEGKKHTVYSLRHTYITFRLRFGKNLSIYSLAKNCGTSVGMIEQFYSDAVPEDFVDELTI
tara:strand:- start:393 stop:1667 length:1275 start_codon:yes stop_codon:yes gene_type:complete